MAQRSDQHVLVDERPPKWHWQDLRSPVQLRRFLPDLVDLIANGAIDPGKVFDLTLPLDDVAEGYRAMDELRAIKTLLSL
jgi:threonine dehydrogenase-like Zn-dependent dehydrogenase